VAARRDDPTILAWQLADKPEAPEYEGGLCAPDAHAVLKAFAADVCGVVKAADPNHLVPSGHWQRQLRRLIHRVAGSAGHPDHRPLRDPRVLRRGRPPRDAFNGIGVRIEQCGALGKPIIIGGVGLRGWRLPTGPPAAPTSSPLGVTSASTAELAWAWTKDGSGVTDFDIGPGDPV
jgi:hypothetical protein